MTAKKEKENDSTGNFQLWHHHNVPMDIQRVKPRARQLSSLYSFSSQFGAKEYVDSVVAMSAGHVESFENQINQLIRPTGQVKWIEVHISWNEHQPKQF